MTILTPVMIINKTPQVPVVPAGGAELRLCGGRSCVSAGGGASLPVPGDGSADLRPAARCPVRTMSVSGMKKQLHKASQVTGTNRD